MVLDFGMSFAESYRCCSSNYLRLIPKQQAAIACISCAADRHLFTDLKYVDIQTLFSLSFQPPGLRFHLRHTYAKDGAGGVQSPRWLHGSQGLGCAEGILQIPGEGLRVCSLKYMKTSLASSCVRKW